LYAGGRRGWSLVATNTASDDVIVGFFCFKLSISSLMESWIDHIVRYDREAEIAEATKELLG